MKQLLLIIISFVLAISAIALASDDCAETFKVGNCECTKSPLWYTISIENVKWYPNITPTICTCSCDNSPTGSCDYYPNDDDCGDCAEKGFMPPTIGLCGASVGKWGPCGSENCYNPIAEKHSSGSGEISNGSGSFGIFTYLYAGGPHGTATAKITGHFDVGSCELKKKTTITINEEVKTSAEVKIGLCGCPSKGGSQTVVISCQNAAAAKYTVKGTGPKQLAKEIENGCVTGSSVTVVVTPVANPSLSKNGENKKTTVTITAEFYHKGGKFLNSDTATIEIEQVVKCPENENIDP